MILANPPSETRTNIRYVSSLPYNKEITNTIKNALKKYGMNIGMSVHNIRDMMINNKDPTEKKDKIGVYEIPIEVEEGKNMVYVGSTVRR